ncbi:MAG TPA: DUF1361 domain-containing protein [Verrucomicrobiae bacterium]|nr:DUF1361 domain-containing protein [Verrucomicrobiae bacterium]
MKLLKIILKPETAFPLLALLFASAADVLLVALRIGWTRNWEYFSLVWNLFLAWLPLAFSLAAFHLDRKGDGGGWRLYGLGLLWLLFFPNAPYIFTDLIHLTTAFRADFWVDLSLVLLVALTGFLLGFVSLYLMQTLVARRWGRAAGWLFSLLACGLGGFGIYLGRFLRWNSWSVVTHPMDLSRDIGHWAAHPLADPARSAAFPALFATFLFLGYLMLYALTHLPNAHRPAEPAP